MYKKLCPKCQQPSFSSSDAGAWICPVCLNDLTRVPHQNAECRRKDKPQLFLIKNRYSLHNKPSRDQVSPYIIKSFD
jgi:uncharacterized Zn finger protein (UPF0148 family)